MGHLVGKDIYRKLGKKIDNRTLRAPWNDTLFAIVKEIAGAADDGNFCIHHDAHRQHLE